MADSTLRPRRIWEEQTLRQIELMWTLARMERVKEIAAVIDHCARACEPIPEEWRTELLEHAQAARVANDRVLFSGADRCECHDVYCCRQHRCTCYASVRSTHAAGCPYGDRVQGTLQGKAPVTVS